MLLDTKMAQAMEILSREHKELHPILHNRYHGCWWPGDARSQGISSNSIDLVILEYSWGTIKQLGFPRFFIESQNE